MQSDERNTTRLAGVLLIVGPLLLVCAALVAAAGIGTTSGRWYDNRLEGVLMAAGFGLQLIGLLELSRRIGASRPILGVLAALASAIGTIGAIFPVAARITGAAGLEMGLTVEQLDRIFGASDDGTNPSMAVLPFLLIFFLNYLVLLPLSLWRSKTGPRFAPLLLVIGSVLFIVGQSAFEVVWPAYIGGVTAWFLALGGQGLALLRELGSKPRIPMGVVSEG